VTLVLHIWRQKTARAEGTFAGYEVRSITPELFFLEMLDTPERAARVRGPRPIAFESDSREGICGSCSVMIDSVAHGPVEGTMACQLHRRHCADGAELVIEPWRAGVPGAEGSDRGLEHL
jgi:succinate dehydrogenase / fumarate reductase, iron-sulfur subunit